MLSRAPTCTNAVSVILRLVLNAPPLPSSSKSNGETRVVTGNWSLAAVVEVSALLFPAQLLFSVTSGTRNGRSQKPSRGRGIKSESCNECVRHEPRHKRTFFRSLLPESPLLFFSLFLFLLLEDKGQPTDDSSRDGDGRMDPPQTAQTVR